MRFAQYALYFLYLCVFLLMLSWTREKEPLYRRFAWWMIVYILVLALLFGGGVRFERPYLVVSAVAWAARYPLTMAGFTGRSRDGRGPREEPDERLEHHPEDAAKIVREGMYHAGYRHLP